MLDAPMFGARWRWIAGTSLALPRFQGGKKVPAPLQRMRAEDLMAAVFPDQIACAENLSGPREIPDHPLVAQAVHDCLYEAMDVEGLERLLADIESGRVAVIARDLTEPSPLALEILTARPYAYLDDAPLEERRAQAVMSRRWLDDASAAGLGRLDVAAIERVCTEAWPEAANIDELHDALLGLGFVTPDDVDRQPPWRGLLDSLALERRATCVWPGAKDDRSSADARSMWVAAERLPQFHAVYPDARLAPPIDAPAEFRERTWTRDDALTEIVRSRLEGLGPVTTRAIADSMSLSRDDIEGALARLVAEGSIMSGSFTPGAAETEWCDRALLARIHRYTVKRLRQEIEPVSSKDFLRFLFRWQHVIPNEQRHGPDALDAVIAQLQGFEAPAAAWESEILPARLEDYEFTWLDDLCLSGRVVWTRLSHTANPVAGGRGPIRTTPVTLLPRRSAPLWTRAAPPPVIEIDELGSRARAVVETLRSHGASFYDEIVHATGLLRTQVEDALAELVAAGLVASDSFAGLRALLTPSEKRKPLGKAKRHRRSPLFGIEEAGRWSLVKRTPPDAATKRAYYEPDQDMVEHIVNSLLRRYGVVFWRLLQREAAWLPAWRDMLRVLRRLEARGDIRGGRFVAGSSGEQFALPEAIPMLRDTRRAETSGVLVSISGADPLNLVGVIAPGEKVPALLNNRVLYRDGIAVATLTGGEITWLEDLEPADARAAESALVKRQVGSPLLAYLR
jgi:ATP-dependent Lhr-like helicase